MCLAITTARLSTLEERPPLLQKMAHRRLLGKDTHRFAPSFASAKEAGPSAERWRSKEPVGQEHRCGRGPARLRQRQEGEGHTKRHLLVEDTEGLVLKAKVHSAKVMDHDGINTLLKVADQAFPGLSHLWLDGGYRAEDKGKDWALRRPWGGAWI